MQALGSAAFVVWMYGLLVVMGIACLPALVLPRRAAIVCVRVWLDLVFWGLKTFCGITYEVRGTEHRPTSGALVASKHQSMFETLMFWRELPDPAIILKRSLAYLPFFGWYTMKLRNISVDRAGHANALRAMLREARARAGEGRQVLIFPEGTRMTPGAPPDYKPGIAALYRDMGVACTPVALNSGLYWPGKGWRRTPGRIIVEFLPAIEPGLSRAAFMTELETRIETASNALLPDAVRAAEPMETV